MYLSTKSPERRVTQFEKGSDGLATTIEGLKQQLQQKERYLKDAQELMKPENKDNFEEGFAERNLAKVEGEIQAVKDKLALMEEISGIESTVSDLTGKKDELDSEIVSTQATIKQSREMSQMAGVEQMVAEQLQKLATEQEESLAEKNQEFDNIESRIVLLNLYISVVKTGEIKSDQIDTFVTLVKESPDLINSDEGQKLVDFLKEKSPEKANELGMLRTVLDLISRIDAGEVDEDTTLDKDEIKCIDILIEQGSPLFDTVSGKRLLEVYRRFKKNGEGNSVKYLLSLRAEDQPNEAALRDELSEEIRVLEDYLTALGIDVNDENELKSIAKAKVDNVVVEVEDKLADELDKSGEDEFSLEFKKNAQELLEQVKDLESRIKDGNKDELRDEFDGYVDQYKDLRDLLDDKDDVEELKNILSEFPDLFNKIDAAINTTENDTELPDDASDEDDTEDTPDPENDTDGDKDGGEDGGEDGENGEEDDDNNIEINIINTDTEEKKRFPRFSKLYNRLRNFFRGFRRATSTDSLRYDYKSPKPAAPPEVNKDTVTVEDINNDLTAIQVELDNGDSGAKFEEINTMLDDAEKKIDENISEDDQEDLKKRLAELRKQKEEMDDSFLEI